MNQYKYFTQEGGLYKFKPQTIYKSIIVILLLAICVGLWKADIKPLIFLFGLLALMIIAGMFTDKFEIDTNNKKIVVKDGVVRATQTIDFDQIVNFEMLTTTTNFIRSSVALNLYFLNNKGKERVVKVAQGISKNHMQNILNEVDEIMGNERN